MKCDNAFYLRATSTGFSKQAVGHNTLERIVKELMVDAGINGYFTLHSLRATAATRLYNNGQDEQAIMHVTGHRSSAVREYKRMGEKMKRNISAILHAEGPEETHEDVKTETLSESSKLESSSYTGDDRENNINSQGSQTKIEGPLPKRVKMRVGAVNIEINF